MIIDFHSHIFPDKIANSTISSLKSKSGNNAYTDGTVDGLINSVINNGADISITLPVLTKPTQFDSVSRFIIEVNERFAFKKRKIISFGGISTLLQASVFTKGIISTKMFVLQKITHAVISCLVCLMLVVFV